MNLYTYTVRDVDTGKILAEGTAGECAEKMQVRPETIRNWAINGIRSKGFDVTRVLMAEDPEADERWVRKWDRLCAELRKKWGLEVKTE